jgi:dynein heavy chain
VKSELFLDFFFCRDSGVDILSAVDDIRMMLDDNILKSQTMRGSSHIKPFEAEMQAWETKLISMQDILDAWLEVIITQFLIEISNNM